MLDRKKVEDETAKVKDDARSEFEKALAALIALAFRYTQWGDDFMWERDEELNAEANKILRSLSDDLLAKAKTRLRKVLADLEGYDEDEVFSYGQNLYGTDVIARLDMQGSHLKEILAIWIALAFLNGLSQKELYITILRYIGNPFLSPLWSGLPRRVIAWGRGYDINIINGLALILQDFIIGSARFAEWQEAYNGGAKYYIRHRGSTYDCPECDSYCERPIPIEMLITETHARCMCWNEYFYGEIPQ